MSQHDEILVYAQIGDLHTTTAAENNHRDHLAIVAELESFGQAIDVVVLPGDIAENGTSAQYELASDALRGLTRTKIRAIGGDHDMEQGSLAAFRDAFAFSHDLPFAETIKGVRCLFLDMCEAGQGGLDFRIDDRQRGWLDREIAAHQRCAVFMHTYPSDLTVAGERLATIGSLASQHVLIVGIGHTHYNELSNDGDKVYAATRSTGQIEEDDGAAGYSIATIDGNIVSWRFRRLGQRGPVVLVTAPADRRLATSHTVRTGAATTLRATILSSRGIAFCRYSCDGAPPVDFSGPGPHFSAALDLGEVRAIAVEATDLDGHATTERVELTVPADLTRRRHADGSDADRIDHWIERGIVGTQLGPNRNGRGW